MQQKIIKLLLIMGWPIISYGQISDSTSHELTKRERRAARHHTEYGEFNYRYLRIALPRPSGNFANPMQSIPEAVGNFAFTNKVTNTYTVGLEGGGVRHFGAVGTDMLQFGINSGWAMQAFGQGDNNGPDYQVHSDGTYLLRIGLGPQFSFKPHEDFRVGVYYRFGVALIYSTYQNQQDNGPRTDKVETQLMNAAYNGDLGLDLCYRKLCLGFAWSMMKVQLSKGQLFNTSIINGNSVNAYTITSPAQSSTIAIDPKFDLNRFVISAGFAF